MENILGAPNANCGTGGQVVCGVTDGWSEGAFSSQTCMYRENSSSLLVAAGRVDFNSTKESPQFVQVGSSLSIFNSKFSSQL